MIKWSPKSKNAAVQQTADQLFSIFWPRNSGQHFYRLNAQAPIHIIYRCVRQRRKEKSIALSAGPNGITKNSKNCFIGQFKTGATTQKKEKKKK